LTQTFGGQAADVLSQQKPTSVSKTGVGFSFGISLVSPKNLIVKPYSLF